MQNVDFQPSSEAIEVTTTFDATVIDVAHLRPARPQKRWLPFACGALLALVAALAFGRAVSTASADKSAKEAWMASAAPVAEYRPAHLPIAYDFLAAFGLLGAIGAFGFGMWRVGRREKSSLIGGTSDKADVALAALVSDVSLVEATPQGAVVTRTPSLSMTVMAAGRELSVDDAVAAGLAADLGSGRVVLRQGADAVLESGMTKLFVRYTEAPRSRTAAALWSFEGRSVQFFAGSALAHAAVLALLFSIPPDASSLSLDSGLASARLARVDSPAFEDQPEDQPEPSDGSGTGGDAEPTDALMSPPDGQTGEPDKTSTTGRFTIARRSDTPQLSRSEAIERAKTGGILGSFSGGDPFANMVHGTADFSSGFDEADVRGGIDGDVGAVRGSWGQWGVVGGVGTGPGWGLNKVGKLRWGQGNNGFGTCRPGQKCTGNGPGLHARTKRKPEVTISRATSITGDPDPSIIRRYIRRKLPRARHCYEQRLISVPDLSGTVTARFTISPQGVVLSSQASGSGDAGLNGCVKDAMSSIAFPRFRTVVTVKYPFTFHRAG